MSVHGGRAAGADGHAVERAAADVHHAAAAGRQRAAVDRAARAPRFTVEPVPLERIRPPVLVMVPGRVSVPPAVASSVPVLVTADGGVDRQRVARLLASIVPLLIRRRRSRRVVPI